MMHKMLKTVKVGNTSLQYTVVSQNDESSLASSTVNVLPTSSRRRSRTRYRKTVILVLITMVMGCGIVIAAVLVPILIASKLVGSLPESAKFKTFAISADSIPGYGGSSRDHHDQQEHHRYVELLPVKQPPIDATIEFQDEFPSASWSIDGKLFFNSPSSSSSRRSTEAPSSTTSSSITHSSVKTFISNSSDVTIYYNNKTAKVAAKNPSEEETTLVSDWVTVTIRVVNNISASLIENAFLVATAFAVLVAFVIVLGVTHYCWKHKAHPNKMKWKEDKTVCNKLLTTVPMTDD